MASRDEGNPERSPAGRQAQPRGQARCLPLAPRTWTPPQPAAPHTGHPQRPPLPEAPAPRQLQPGAPHRYRAAAPASHLRPLPQQRLTPAAIPVSCITNLPPSHSHPAPQVGHAPARGMPGVVVPNRRVPRPAARLSLALELQLPGASAAKRPLTGSNTEVVRRQSPLALFLPGLSGREEAVRTEVEGLLSGGWVCPSLLRAARRWRRLPGPSRVAAGGSVGR